MEKKEIRRYVLTINSDRIITQNWRLIPYIRQIKPMLMHSNLHQAYKIQTSKMKDIVDEQAGNSNRTNTPFTGKSQHSEASSI